MDSFIITQNSLSDYIKSTIFGVDSMSTILYTSLAEIKSFNPCPSGWKDILKGQGKTEADDVLFPLIDCVESNSISDVCWLIGMRKIEIDICVKFARMCADSVSHLKNAAYAYADAAADAATYAVACAAADAADAATYDAAAADAATYTATYAAQKEKNKQFLIKAITDYQSSH